MSYPGNSSLGADIQERIEQTFQQTLELAQSGNRADAKAGCDFILRLDPLFVPAQKLAERLETAGDGPVTVDDLAATPSGGDDQVFAPPTAPEATATPSADVFSPPPAPAEDTGPGLEPAAELDSLGTSEPAMPAIAGPETAEVAALDSALDLSALTGGGAPSGERQGADSPSEPQPIEIPAELPVDTALDSESTERIETLLAEGQTAFEAREYQSAIDAWSRIFLIDIDHQEANRRIELARKLKDEIERQVEELFHEAVGKVETGDHDGARAGFAKVLEMQPTHLAAQEYLDKLNAPPEEKPAPPQAPPSTPAPAAPPAALDLPAEAGPAAPPAAAVSPPGAPPSEAPDTLEMAVDALQIPGLEDQGAALNSGDALNVELPPMPDGETEAPVKKAKGRSVRPSLLYIGGAVLVLVAAGAWLLARNWSTAFPNATPEPPAQQRARVDPIARATQLHNDGNTALALAQLQRLPPSHEKYAEAQILISQWATPEREPDAGPLYTDEQLAARDELVSEAEAAIADREFLIASDLLGQAAEMAELEESTMGLRRTVEQELAPLRSEIEIFRQGEWAEALRSLWRLREADPGNPDIEQLMLDSYYNLGVRALQRGDPNAASENFGEAIKLSDDDFEIQRAMRFAEMYQQRSPDLQYRIFVKYLPFR